MELISVKLSKQTKPKAMAQISMQLQACNLCPPHHFFLSFFLFASTYCCQHHNLPIEIGSTIITIIFILYQIIVICLVTYKSPCICFCFCIVNISIAMICKIGPMLKLKQGEKKAHHLWIIVRLNAICKIPSLARIYTLFATKWHWILHANKQRTIILFGAQLDPRVSQTNDKYELIIQVCRPFKFRCQRMGKISSICIMVCI